MHDESVEDILKEMRAKTECMPDAYKPLGDWVIQCCLRIATAWLRDINKRALIAAASMAEEKK